MFLQKNKKKINQWQIIKKMLMHLKIYLYFHDKIIKLISLHVNFFFLIEL